MFKAIARFFKSRPVNIIGPFELPLPDDPRWVRKRSPQERWYAYELEGIRCLFGVNYSNGIVYINDKRITNAELRTQSLTERFTELEDRYAMAIHRAYVKAHGEPEEELPRAVLEIREQFARYLESLKPSDESEKTER